MSIKRKCENCANVKYCRHIQKEEFTRYCDNYKYFTPTEKLIRRDERDKIYKLLSKVCLLDNAKFGFQLDGKDYLITRVGYIDTFEEMIRDEERYKIITLLKSDLEKFDGLADECVERKDIHELLENNAVRKYIESTIELLDN